MNSNNNDWVLEYKQKDIFFSDEKISKRFKYWWNANSGDWNLLEENYAYWSELVTSKPQIFTPGVIYPNPVNRLLTIAIDQPGHHSIEIISLNGQLIYR